MLIREIIWLEEVVEKIEWKHNVSVMEVEQLFRSRPSFKKMLAGKIQSEDVFRALGKTDAGRYLIIFFILKRTNEALIISARDMDSKERKSYGKK